MRCCWYNILNPTANFRLMVLSINFVVAVCKACLTECWCYLMETCIICMAGYKSWCDNCKVAVQVLTGARDVQYSQNFLQLFPLAETVLSMHGQMFHCLLSSHMCFHLFWRLQMRRTALHCLASQRLEFLKSEQYHTVANRHVQLSTTFKGNQPLSR